MYNLIYTQTQTQHTRNARSIYNCRVKYNHIIGQDTNLFCVKVPFCTYILYLQVRTVSLNSVSCAPLVRVGTVLRNSERTLCADSFEIVSIASNDRVYSTVSNDRR